MPFVKFTLLPHSSDVTQDHSLIIDTESIKSLASVELHRRLSDGKVEHKLVLRLTTDLPLTVYDITETADEAYKIIQESLGKIPSFSSLSELGKFIEHIHAHCTNPVYNCVPASTILGGPFCLPTVIEDALDWVESYTPHVRYTLASKTDIETGQKKLTIHFHFPKYHSKISPASLLKEFDTHWNCVNLDRLEYKVSFFTGKPY